MSKVERVTNQGYMDVESEALDDAFADTDVKPRQRLISVELDYLLDAVDCARCTFADPDGRIGKGLRVGSKFKVGDMLSYTPWTAYIGYFGQPKEEMRSLTGIPMLETPKFPESGVPTTTIKILSPSVALKKNTTPFGGPQEYIDATGTHSDNQPLRRAITEIAKYYQLSGPVWGDTGMDDVITRLDKAVIERNKLDHLNKETTGEIYQATKTSGMTYLVQTATAWNRIPADKNDAAYLSRIAKAITTDVQSGIVDYQTSNSQFFNDLLPGHPSKSDLKVVWGVWDNKLLFCFMRDYLKLIGLDHIPIIDYRVGNNLLRSFSPSTQAANDQTGGLMRIFQGYNRDDADTDKAKSPEIKVNPAKDDAGSAGAASLNAMKVDKFVSVVRSLPDNSIGSATVDIDTLKRSLNTDIKGTVTTYGSKYFIAGNLVCLAGLPYGLMKETDDDKAQVFASYNRIYVIDHATHKMDNTGLYDVTLEVSGSSVDGSDKTVLANFEKRIAEGAEGQDSGSGGWWDLFLDKLK